MGKTVTTHKTTLYGYPTDGFFKELDLATIPESIPKLGIEAGTVGTVDLVYQGGRRADVAVSRGGDIISYVTIDADPEPHVVAYTVEDDD
jgi:hypothetical protein